MGMDGEKYGAGLTPEARLARLEQLLIPKTIGTTEGDLIGFDDSGLPVRIPAAAGNGYSITSDTSQTGGVKWEKAAYIAPTFAGTWTHFGTTLRDVGYTKLPTGLVSLVGLAKRTGTSGLTLFTLPAGYRPLEDLVVLVMSTSPASSVARLDIQADGDVVLQIADPGTAITFVTLTGITFLAEA
jgi:hypothetical protein